MFVKEGFLLTSSPKKRHILHAGADNQENPLPKGLQDQHGEGEPEGASHHGLQFFNQHHQIT